MQNVSRRTWVEIWTSPAEFKKAGCELKRIRNYARKVQKQHKRLNFCVIMALVSTLCPVTLPPLTSCPSLAGFSPPQATLSCLLITWTLLASLRK